MDFIRGILSIDDNKMQLHVRSYEGSKHNEKLVLPYWKPQI